ncbi:MAG TPA: hypothetical protein VFJ47_04615 [Terriglobales bacterium]|nr:hypothetical protein [Terriglobales bacterium]
MIRAGFLSATPKRRATLWFIANLAFIFLIPAAVLYYTRQSLAGAYPEDADSISIPIIETAISVLLFLLPLNLVWWWLLRRYPGKVPLYTSAKNLGAVVRVISFVGLLVAILCVIGAVVSIRGQFELAPILLVWSYVALALRAAYVVSRTTISPENENNRQSARGLSLSN